MLDVVGTYIYVYVLYQTLLYGTFHVGRDILGKKSIKKKLKLSFELNFENTIFAARINLSEPIHHH